MLNQNAAHAGGSDVPAFSLEIEAERLRALVAANLPVADRLHTDDYQLIPPGGRRMSKSDYLGAIASGAIDYHVFQPDSAIVLRDYGSAAVLRYQARIEITVDGQRYPPDLVWHTDLYEQRDGRWQCVWSQATRIPIPSG
jgi:hypothetical protein